MVCPGLPGSTLVLPIRCGSEILVPARFPIPIRPAVVAELWRVLELAFGDVRDVAFLRRIVSDGTPRQWIMAVAEAKEAAKAHDSVPNLSRNLVDHEMIDPADFVSALIIYVRAFDSFTGDEVECGVGCSHVLAPPREV
jgi:hypothetical protein